MEENDFKPFASSFSKQNADPTLVYVYINQCVNHDFLLARLLLNDSVASS